MCGIAGILDFEMGLDASRQLMEGMLRTQAHRGPDATGIWSGDGVVLGHNRLSIIDLSDAANQPMEFDGLVLVFNGEVYNYIEIRKELELLGHVFSTSSDTEVVIHAYREWGGGCVNRFMGMWAFAIWDEKKRVLFASRDRFGIKPFHYIRSGNRMHFASEVKSLKRSPLFTNELNLNQVSRGLQMGWMSYGEETYFNAVKNIPAAHNMYCGADGVRLERYWDLSSSVKTDESYEGKVDRFREKFLESISLHLRSDVPVASCLSGGIDSSSIVSAVQHGGHKGAYKTFSIYYEGKGDVDERSFVKDVVSRYPQLEPHYYSPTDNEISDSYDRALYHCDFPATGSSFMSQYFLMQLISQNGIKVVLDGQGADEYLGGYMHTYYRLIGDMLGTFGFGNAISATRSVTNNIGLGTAGKLAHLGKSFLNVVLSEQQLYGLEYKKYYPFLSINKSDTVPFNLQADGQTRVDKFLYNLLFSTSLPTLLHFEDRNSMAFSIESRVPFLDHRLVEYAFSLNDADRITPERTKRILRDAMRGIIPDSVYNRKDKKGFVTPGESKWLRGPLSRLVSSDMKIPDFLDKERVGKLLTDYRNGDNSKATMVWRLAVLVDWIGKGNGHP
ncbi:MAG: asparagine synthase (glutamine-hydrolyzing) [Bacteroidota bacterium]